MLCQKKSVVKRILIANESSDDERVDKSQPSTSQITLRRRVSKQKKTQEATAWSPPLPPPDSWPKPPTANLTPSKFLPLLFDDELSSLSEDDSKDECMDNKSGGIESDSSEEGTQVSERKLEDEEQGGDIGAM